MITLESLKEVYKPGAPILIENLENQFGCTRTTVTKSMSLLTKKGIRRYSRGVYYIPQKTLLGESKLNPSKVISAKYIGDDDKVKGVYSGLMILNKLGLTTQVPNIIEVVTNSETNIKREVIVGKQKVILRKPAAKINSENAKIIELLEAVKMLKTISTEQKKKIVSYAKDNDITRSKLDRVMIYYPKKVYKTLVEGGILNEITS